MTNAGGPGILATDMTVSSDLELARFSEETIENLARHLPSTANISNPVDIIGDASQTATRTLYGRLSRTRGWTVPSSSSRPSP